MNTAFHSSRQARAASVIALAILSVLAGTARAQQGVTSDEFYRQGDQISNKVSNFMRGIFGSGAPVGTPLSERYLNPTAPAPSYNQPAAAPTTRSTVQAPSSSTYKTLHPSAPTPNW